MKVKKNNNEVAYCDKKISVWWFALVFFVLELILYIIEIANISHKEFVVGAISPILIGACCFYFFDGKKKFNKEYLIYVIIAIGFLIRHLYIFKIDIYTMQHDVSTIDNYGHLRYIYLLFSTGKLPASNIGQFYHPPLFHLLGALWLKINDLFGIGLGRSLEGLQYLTLYFSSLMLIIMYKITDKLNVKFNVKLLINLFMAFFPTYIILAGSINNDCLLTFLEVCIIYYLILWNDNDSLLNTIILALLTGLCVMTKLNGAIMAVPILFVFIRRFIAVFKEYKEDESKRGELFILIRKILLFGIISLPIGLWFQIRCYALFGSNSVPNPSDWLYVGYVSPMKRFVLVDFKNLLKVFCQLPGEYSIVNYIFKCSIFGEFSYEGPTFIHWGMLILNIILICTSVFYTVKYFFDKDKHDFLTNLLIINWATNMICFYIFYSKYPYICTMDYRYITTTVFTGVVLLGKYIDDNSFKSKFFKGCIIAFVFLCCMFEIFSI